MAGYALAWLEFPGRDWVFIGDRRAARRAAPDGADPDVQALRQTSASTAAILSIILFHVAFGLPFAIFLLRNFFVGIPKDIMESARIDGANELLDLRAPDAAARAARDRLARDLPVPLDVERPDRLAHLRRQPITVWIFGQLREFGTSIDVIAPASFISLVVPLCVFFAFQRYFVQGLLAGSVK